MPAPISTAPVISRMKPGSVRRLITCSATPLARMPGIIDSDGADRVVADAAGQREGEHADEMHAPDAAAHRGRAGAGPGPSGAARVGGLDAAGDRQRDESRQCRDDNRQGDQFGAVGAGIGHQRMVGVENGEKPPIKVQHGRLARIWLAASLPRFGKERLNASANSPTR